MPSMTHPALRLGYDTAELAGSPYARFFNPAMAPLPAHVREALAVGAVARELIPPVAQSGALQEPGYQAVETGYTLCPDGSARVAVRTEMPGVTPSMWDWWFAWHGSEAQRYKLWHPLAHVDVGWADGRDDLAHYVGRTSHVTEYLGANCFRVGIRFLSPSSMGLNESALHEAGETAICARVSMKQFGIPIESVWMVHHIRPIEGGAEMRSRFWVGGSNVRILGLPPAIGRCLGQLAGRLQPVTDTQARELMVHDAQEMNHLAAILPDLFATFGPQAR